jgi:hypothetical protein
LNSEKIWKLWKKSRLNSEDLKNSEKIWKLWKKSKLNSEKIWKIWKISVLVIITPKETSSSPSFPPSSSPSLPPPPPLTDISNVVFQTLRFEKAREMYGKMKCFIT